jgi:hypothetical protein
MLPNNVGGIVNSYKNSTHALHRATKATTMTNPVKTAAQKLTSNHLVSCNLSRRAKDELY